MTVGPGNTFVGMDRDEMRRYARHVQNEREDAQAPVEWFGVDETYTGWAGRFGGLVDAGDAYEPPEKFILAYGNADKRAALEDRRAADPLAGGRLPEALERLREASVDLEIGAVYDYARDLAEQGDDCGPVCDSLDVTDATRYSHLFPEIGGEALTAAERFIAFCDDELADAIESRREADPDGARRDSRLETLALYDGGSGVVVVDGEPISVPRLHDYADRLEAHAYAPDRELEPHIAFEGYPEFDSGVVDDVGIIHPALADHPALDRLSPVEQLLAVASTSDEARRLLERRDDVGGDPSAIATLIGAIREHAVGKVQVASHLAGKTLIDFYLFRLITEEYRIPGEFVSAIKERTDAAETAALLAFASSIERSCATVDANGRVTDYTLRLPPTTQGEFSQQDLEDWLTEHAPAIPRTVSATAYDPDDPMPGDGFETGILNKQWERTIAPAFDEPVLALQVRGSDAEISPDDFLSFVDGLGEFLRRGDYPDSNVVVD